MTSVWPANPGAAGALIGDPAWPTEAIDLITDVRLAANLVRDLAAEAGGR